ncbi:TonB-dependent receptor [Chitinophaga caseinilytica]|uniref:TonB-dependent receptor n=1 Tax=Chitinophaga caseinilytica TaxID=2267521 RepID=A0ABZ2YY05_9BACT
MKHPPLHNILLLASVLSAAGKTAAAQERPAARDSVHPLTEVIVTANKFEEKSRFVAQKVEVMHAPEIRASLSNNTGGLLEQSGKVFVQRSQLGGGSPVLRGFEASRILLVVDGVRMNNAIYRTGHLQNVITIDDDITEKVEIIYGPASTIYGSDALGGVIHFRTKDPQFHRFSTNISARYSSAFEEYTGHLDVNAGGRKFASLTSFSYSDVGDLRMGARRNRHDGDWGKRRQFIGSVNGVDSVLSNADERIQRNSGYRQYDLLQKFRWQPKEGHEHLFNIQYSTSSDIPRYDRLTDLRNGKLRWAEWYYGPQDRLMAAWQFKSSRLNGFFDQLMAGASYQSVEESRMQRAYRNPQREHRIENIHVAAFHLDLRKSKGRHELNVGGDGQLNFLKSTAFRQNIQQGEKQTGLDTRYPDGQNRMHYFGAYAQHLYKIVPGKLILNDGLRANYTALRCTFADTSILHLPFTEANQRHVTWSANLGLIYLPDTQTKLSFDASTGYRAPNIDDIAKVFESAGGAQLVVPNPDLRPEQTVNFDLGAARQFGERLFLELNGFYSLLRNAIVLDAFLFNGKPGVVYNGQLTPVVAAQNKAKATIAGFQAAAQWQLLPRLRAYGNVTYTHGRYTDAKGARMPMDHIPPVFGKAGVQFGWKQLETEGYVLFNGWKKSKDYNPNGEDNLVYATPEGTPSWTTLNLSARYPVLPWLKVQAGLENLLDIHYRVFASGISSPGRNVVLKLQASF